MKLYVFFILILLMVLAFATSSRSVKVGCLLSGTQTNRGYVSTHKLKGKLYKTKTISNIIALTLLILMWVFTAFRASYIGNDTNNYINYFKDINVTGISSEYRIEYGFQILCLFVGLFTTNPNMFLAVCATICYVGVGYYAFRYSKNILESVILIFAFCFSIFTNTLRQDIAMVICLYAYQAVKNKRNFKAFIYILLAATFHKSAFVCLLWIFYKFFSLRKKVNITLAISIAIISILGLIQLILSKLGLYDSYANSKYSGTGWLAVGYGCMQSLAFYLFMHNAYAKDLMRKRLVLVNCAFYLFINCFGFSINLFTRAAGYFVLPLIVELPNACYDGKLKHKNFWLVMICLILLLYFIVSLIFRPEWNRLYPYNFFWSEIA